MIEGGKVLDRFTSSFILLYVVTNILSPSIFTLLSASLSFVRLSSPFVVLFLVLIMNLGAEGNQLGIKGRVGGGRGLTTRNVADMSGLCNAASSYISSSSNSNIITKGDKVEVALGTYQCNESRSNCAYSYSMLVPSNLCGSIECTNDSADCVIDRKSSRRVIEVNGSEGGTLIIRALPF